jgi:glycosyltransferase involved in cell wall biosynthesis
LRKFAAAIIAIDGHVRASLPEDLTVDVIHNGLTPPSGPLCNETAVPEAAQAFRPFTAGMVGTITRGKGCLVFVEAAALLKARGISDVRFVFFGASLRSARSLRAQVLRWLGIGEDIDADLQHVIVKHGLENVVQFRGFSADVARIYSEIDVLCFPSHFDAPGRPILEAAFFAVPSIAALSSPLDDTFVHGRTGIAIPPGSAVRLCDALEFLLRHPEQRRSMGENARRFVAEQFDAGRTARLVLEVYRDRLSRVSAVD